MQYPRFFKIIPHNTVIYNPSFELADPCPHKDLPFLTRIISLPRITVVTRKLLPQPPEKRSLLLVKSFSSKGPVMEIVALCHSDTSMTASVDCFNRVGTHEYRNIASNRHFGDIELMSQIVVCIMPSQAQHFQQFLASLCGTHALTPPSVAPWGQ